VFGINAWEMIAIAVIALLVFGPERLPELASQGARMLRELRRMATGAKQDLQESLGPELSDLNISDLDPRTFVKRNLFDPIDDEVKDVKRSVNGSDDTDGDAPRPRPTFDSDTT
jgi:sec-independent protein translocase protein TatB